jgi:hypothetical protein
MARNLEDLTKDTPIRHAGIQTRVEASATRKPPPYEPEVALKDDAPILSTLLSSVLVNNMCAIVGATLHLFCGGVKKWTEWFFCTHPDRETIDSLQELRQRVTRLSLAKKEGNDSCSRKQASGENLVGYSRGR